MSSILTVTTEEGQIIFGTDILKHLGINRGEKITVEKHSNGRIEVKAARRTRRTGRISDVFNRLQKKGNPSLSIEEINEAVADAWAGQQ